MIASRGIPVKSGDPQATKNYGAAQRCQASIKCPWHWHVSESV